MEPKHLARDDISAFAWDIEETSWERRKKTSLNDWTQAFLVVELNQRARQSSGVASALKMPRNRSALARTLLARSGRAARSLSGEGPAGRVASAAITAAASASGSEGRRILRTGRAARDGPGYRTRSAAVPAHGRPR